MKRWLFVGMLLGGCGTHLSAKDARRLRTSLGVEATTVLTAADTRRLEAIAADLRAPDAPTQKLGQVECLLLQTRAETLGRDVATLMPLLVRDAAPFERVSAALTGAVSCGTGMPFQPDHVAKALRDSALEIQQALEQSERRGR